MSIIAALRFTKQQIYRPHAKTNSPPSALRRNRVRRARRPRAAARRRGEGRRRKIRRRRRARPPQQDRHVHRLSWHPGLQDSVPGGLPRAEDRRPAARLYRQRAQGLQGRRALASVDARHRGEPERQGHGRSGRLLRGAGQMNKLLILAIAIAFAPAVSHARGNAESGKAKAAQVCAACHGPEGNKPSAPDPPVLAGQYEDYLVKALNDYKSGKRSNPIMKSFAGQLSKKDMEDLAAWF